MNSLALWYEKTTTKNSQKTDIHINVCKIRNNTEYLEFGILMYNYDSDWGSLNISVPFEISKIEDLSTKLCNSNLISALFNETLNVGEKSKFFTVKSDIDNTIKFRVMTIDDNDLTFKSQDNHTIINIEISGSLASNGKKNTTTYVRFRIKQIGDIFHNVSTNRMLLDGYEEKKGIFEVNINMLRKLPMEIKDNLKNSLSLQSINLFLITDYDTDIIFESKDRVSARILENHIWDDYVGYKALDIEKVVAYQWKGTKVDNEIEDFNIFVKTLVRDKSRWTWYIVIIFILFLGIIGGVGGNFVTSKVFNGFQDVNYTDATNSKGVRK